ncbi:MAG: acetylglutamate kinase [Bryobacterales bacterium]|nr:acetylglutamate kinase [Bryobacterales bacterium]
MKLLVKLGGTLLDNPESRERLAEQIAGISARHQVVVVHGGGKQMTRFLSERGVESRFVGGLRVTTPDVLDALLKVFAGSVNHELVSALVKARVRAVGLSGIDDCLVETELLRPELGAVGRPVRCNAELLNLLTGNGFVPVVACVGGDRLGGIFNVNADQMAVACAVGFGAQALLFLTDVAGVQGEGGAFLPRLTAAGARELIARGIATGGMQAKLESAGAALAGGVGAVRIMPGSEPGILARALNGEALGTTVVEQEG